jgi:S-adenosylmethionine hydrolase
MHRVVRVRPVTRPDGARFDTVSFLSDYGTTDEFAGVVKAVIRDLAPHATVIDLTHEIPPHDIRAGSLALARCIQYVPAGVVLAVVDPGVGTARRAIAVEVAGGAGVIVAPDNGLIAPAVAMTGGPGRAVSLTNTDYHLPAPGATFAGRDLFAPVAAHLCNGVEWDSLGDAVEPAELVPGVLPVPCSEPDGLVAEVLWVDRFGNAAQRRTRRPGELAGVAWSASPGVEGPHGAPGGHLRRDRCRGDRPRAGLLRAPRRGADAPLGGRRARAGTGWDEVTLSAPSEGPRRRHHGAGGAPGPGRPRIGSPPVRPATRSRWPLLLVVIVVAGVASLVLMG